MKYPILFLLLTIPLMAYGQDRCACTGVDEEEEIYKVALRMPIFPGCDYLTDYNEMKRCGDREMMDFMYDNLRYPQRAFENKTEGMVVVSFVIEKDGCVSNMKVVRDPGDGCGREALRVVKLMKARGKFWNPGFNDGAVVRTEFNLPLKFKIAPSTVPNYAGEPDYDPNCEATIYEVKGFADYDLKLEYYAIPDYDAIVQLGVTTNQSLTAKIEIGTPQGRIEYLAVRDLEVGTTVVNINTMNLSRGQKTITLISLDGKHRSEPLWFEF